MYRVSSETIKSKSRASLSSLSENAASRSRVIMAAHETAGTWTYTSRSCGWRRLAEGKVAEAEREREAADQYGNRKMRHRAPNILPEKRPNHRRLGVTNE